MHLQPCEVPFTAISLGPNEDAILHVQVNAGPRQKELWEKRLKEVFHG